MGDGLAAAIGAGDKIGRFVPVRHGARIGLGRAADKARPLGPAAGLAKHGACSQGCLPPRLLASMSAVIHRVVIARSSDSRTFRNAFGAARKKVFL
jgi:hypothetical protein